MFKTLVLALAFSASAVAAESGWKEQVLGSYVAVTREFEVDLSLCKWELDSRPTSPTISAECRVSYFPRENLDQFLRSEPSLDIKTYKDRAGNNVMTMLSPLPNGFLISGTHYRNASSSTPIPVPAGSFSESQALAEELFKLYLRDMLPEGKIRVQVQAVKKP